MIGPTARTLAAVVERWIPRANVRKDFFGIGDVLAVHPRERAIVLVQATAAAHLAHRLAKARARPELALWLTPGGCIEV
jgi:hypothetical protein